MHKETTDIILSKQRIVFSHIAKTVFLMTWLICKSINVKADDPLAMVMLQSFLCEKFRIYWSNTISSFSKLNTYVSFKSKFCMKGYLDTILNRTHRIWYTKIRISNHRFAVETGRFSKIPRDE